MAIVLIVALLLTVALASPKTCGPDKPLNLGRVNQEYLIPMLDWFKAHTAPAGDAPYLNAVAWFLPHLDALPCTNLVTDDTWSTLTVLGETWRDAICPACECPGPDCW